MLCGYSVKGALLRAEFYLDKNKVTTKEVAYKPPSNVEKLVDKRHLDDDCTLIPNIPEGTHVISVVTECDAALLRCYAALSHVIVLKKNSN